MTVGNDVVATQIFFTEARIVQSGQIQKGTCLLSWASFYVPSLSRPKQDLVSSYYF
jgi:hypothetical protein